MTAFGRLLLQRADDDGAALLYENQRCSYNELIGEGWRRAGSSANWATRTARRTSAFASTPSCRSSRA